MNALESQLEYAFGDTLPALGTTLEVAPGILWLRMGLPFALDHINLWLLEDEIETRTGRVRGWTAVDCGIATDVTKESWESIFATQLRGLPIIRVLVTHCHPDHVGLADWLCERWNVPLSYKRMQDQHTVHIGGRDWRVITGFGHSPEHVSLYADDARLLISGDMVLPRISTNVSVFAIEPEANPVQQYLDSLKKYTGLADDTLVLPSHGKPFRGLHTRIGQLNDHHRARLAEVMEACITPKTAVEILPVMFKRPLDTHQLSFALGEAVAHLHKLWFDGVLQRQLGDDGIYRFTAIA